MMIDKCDSSVTVPRDARLLSFGFHLGCPVSLSLRRFIPYNLLSFAMESTATATTRATGKTEDEHKSEVKKRRQLTSSSSTSRC